ncbi:hypothetical protein [Curtobacterium sp. ISL-83]|nr:hypothetical protein [Curtobacterium sp. ISL-83]MBT2502212.1 hypothetical protein [Curtobacterium sp. ISL-83]
MSADRLDRSGRGVRATRTSADADLLQTSRLGDERPVEFTYDDCFLEPPC